MKTTEKKTEKNSAYFQMNSDLLAQTLFIHSG